MSLYIGRPIFETMIAHLKSVYPLEGCGLLAGSDGRVHQQFPIENTLRSPTAYEMEPAQLIAAFMTFEARDQILLAVYHSHPNGPAIPSTADIIQFNYPEALQVIVSFEDPDKPQTGAFWVANGEFSPVSLKVV